MSTEAFKEPRAEKVGRGTSSGDTHDDVLGDLAQDVPHLARPRADHDGLPRLQHSQSQIRRQRDHYSRSECREI